MHNRWLVPALFCLLSIVRAAAAGAAAPPVITTHPANKTMAENTSASFAVVASGTAPLLYQWQNSKDGVTWSDFNDTCTTLSSACRFGPLVSGGKTSNLTFSRWSLSAGSAQFRCVVSDAGGTTISNPATLTVISAVRVSPAALRFAGTRPALGSSLTAVTPTQTVTVTISGVDSRWTASGSASWMQVTGGTETSPGPLRVSVVTANSYSGVTSLSGTVMITSPTANFAFVEIPVTLTVSQPEQTTGAFGSFDTPATGSTVQGSVAVTGWALDDVGVKRVELWRDLQPGETTPPFQSTPSDPRAGKVFIGNPLFVDGARPDVETLNPTTPVNHGAGWGYLLLTFGLWNQGNGSYNLYAYAFDQEDRFTTLGQKTITVNNAQSIKPFGTIDSPGIGATVSGTATVNGWALTPKVNGAATCKIQATGIQVSIDSGPLQPVTFGSARPDIATFFPGYSNTSASGGASTFDSTTLANGTHTVGWLVTDDCNRADGVGSRFFTVQNSGLVASAGVLAAFSTESESGAAITVARGFGELPEIVEPGPGGSRTIEITQGERIEVRVPRGFVSVYQLVNGGQRRDVPIGSSWDAASGIFSWSPAPGFLGRYRLVFGNGAERISVRIVVRP